MTARDRGRRELLRLGLLAGGHLLLGAPTARAVGERTKLALARLAYPGSTAAASRPGALERLVWELTLRTSVVARFDVAEPRPEDPALFDTPFLHLWGSAGFPPFGDEAVRALRRHLEFGGLLLADDGSGHAGSEFERSVRREAARIFPEAPLRRLPDDHSVFRSYYLLRRLGGRVLVSPFLEGATIGDRTPFLFCRNDLAGAWARDSVGRWLHECTPGGEPQRQHAFGLGVNAVLYALTVNYKQDQIHLPFILERMRRSGGAPRR